MDRIVLRGVYTMKMANTYVKVCNPAITTYKKGMKVDGFQISSAGLFKEVSYKSKNKIELVKD